MDFIFLYFIVALAFSGMLSINIVRPAIKLAEEIAGTDDLPSSKHKILTYTIWTIMSAALFPLLLWSLARHGTRSLINTIALKFSENKIMEDEYQLTIATVERFGELLNECDEEVAEKLKREYKELFGVDVGYNGRPGDDGAQD